MYKVVYEPKALKELKKLDKQVARKIVKWVDENLANTDNPRMFGKELTANRSGEWSYRLYDYRILANIVDDVLIIYIFKIGHRKEVYLELK